MNRRVSILRALVSMLALISSSGGTAGVAHAAAAQRVPVVGVLSPGSPGGWAALDTALRAGLTEAGYVDGQNVTIVERYAEGQPDRLPTLAAELASLPADVLVATGGRPSHVAAKQATTTIPFVVADADAVLARELNAGTGSNITGVLFWSAELSDKRLELLQATIPGMKRVAVLRDPSVPNTVDRLQSMQTAAAQRGLEVIPIEAQSADQLGAALDAASQARADALVVLATQLFTDTRDQLAELTIDHRLPTMYESSENAGPRGLIWYGQNLLDDFGRAGGYTARLLDGARVSDLPWLEPQRFELAINLETAQAIGLTVPPAVLAQATALGGRRAGPGEVPAPAQVPARQ